MQKRWHGESWDSLLHSVWVPRPSMLNVSCLGLHQPWALSAFYLSAANLRAQIRHRSHVLQISLPPTPITLVATDLPQPLLLASKTSSAFTSPSLNLLAWPWHSPRQQQQLNDVATADRGPGERPVLCPVSCIVLSALGSTTFYATYTCIVYKVIIRPGRTTVQFQALVLSVEMFSEPWHEFRVLDSASHSLSLQWLYILYIFVQRHLGTSSQQNTFIEMLTQFSVAWTVQNVLEVFY